MKDLFGIISRSLAVVLLGSSVMSCEKDDDGVGRSIIKEHSERTARTRFYAGSVWEGSYQRNTDHKEIYLRIEFLPERGNGYFAFNPTFSDDGGKTYHGARGGGIYFVNSDRTLVLRSGTITDADKWDFYMTTWELIPEYNEEFKIYRLRHRYTGDAQVRELIPIKFAQPPKP